MMNHASDSTDASGLQEAWLGELIYGIYRTGVTWRDQNLGRKVEVIYMDEPCNAC